MTIHYAIGSGTLCGKAPQHLPVGSIYQGAPNRFLAHEDACADCSASMKDNAREAEIDPTAAQIMDWAIKVHHNFCLIDRDPIEHPPRSCVAIVKEMLKEVYDG